MSAITARLLAAIVDRWPSPMAEQDERIGAHGDEEHAAGYAREQFMRKVWFGFGVGRGLPPVWGRVIVELGCGHGGISCYLASLGPHAVLAVDINDESLSVAQRIRSEIETASGRSLPLAFARMDIHRLGLPASSVDVVVADNLFEHVDDPAGLLAEARRVLRPGGLLVVPTFSSIRSKYGLHLKRGLRVPWANLVFSERTIVEALRIRARREPSLLDVYPGLATAKTVRDVRRHRDLNDITYDRFAELAAAEGFEVQGFRIHATPLGQVLRRILPGAGRTRLLEILSTGASATLVRL